ncbi:oligosaccharide flippase family protein [Massilia sp. X63]|uniref:oligosaccharide flippase family protein n=1 Tax=Massilia sp. X63 TaxID=3237285 RepID=UPI0034DCEACD
MMAQSAPAVATVSRRSVGIAFATQYVELGIQFVSVLLLARLLSPDEIGTFSIAAFLMSMLHVFRDFGVAQYIISERDLTREKMRAAAGVSIILALAMAAVLYVLSGPVARFYANPAIENVLVVMSASFAISSFGSTLLGVLRRNAQLGKIFWMKTFGALCHVATALGLAWHGFGALSLAWANFAGILAFAIAGAVVRPAGMAWIPQFSNIRAILSFGSISSVGNLANMAGTSAPDLIMGKVLNMAAVGYFSRATGLVQLFTRLISGALTPLVLPYFSQEQREGKPLVRPYLLAVEYLTALAWPFFAALMVLAYPMVRALYGDNWDASVPMARLLCVASALSVLTLFAPQAMIACGGVRSSTVCNLMVQPVRILAVLVSASFGAVAVAGAIVVAEAIALVMNSVFLYRVVGVHPGKLIRACMRSALITAASLIGPLMVQVTWGDAPASSWPPLLVGIISAAAGWLVGMWLSRHPLGTHVFPLIGIHMRPAPLPLTSPTLKQRVRGLAYRCGLLSIWHRLRNRDTLTVAMFHRVLPRTDARFAGADPEWTMTPETFDDCLSFFVRHYHVVTPEQVFAALRGDATLPPRSLLVTFDDGWADTAEFAQPLLDRHGLAGLVFVVSGAVDSTAPFWEEQVFAFLATTPNGKAQLDAILAREGLPPLDGVGAGTTEAEIRHAIRQLGALPREKVLAFVAMLPRSDGVSAMINRAQLQQLAGKPHAVGGHGKTHQPLVKVADLAEELGGAQADLAAMLGAPVASMSLPHGTSSPTVLAACRAAGYRYLFGSAAHLNLLVPGAAGDNKPMETVGRIHIAEQAIIGADGRTDPARLAGALFLRARTAIAIGGPVSG